MATERKRKRAPAPIEEPHPSQVKAAEPFVELGVGDDSGADFTDDELRRIKLFLEYQLCRLYVKMGMRGKLSGFVYLERK